MIVNFLLIYFNDTRYIVIGAMYINKNLKYLRNMKGVTQDQVAEIFGKQKAAISAYEKGKNIPPVDVLIKLAQFFEVSLDDFVFRDIEKEGTSAVPVKPTPEDEALTALLARMEKRVAMLEGKIRERDVELARELGLE
ncbi:MAG: helix-turn-helix transcriptional regulator [Haliscomenobacter sp.]|nr:helix-turn-helix transcriptional regulator [Haliscomenobacter sp.]MBK9492297.1 helix-turn-helix transcriptional regulator [Haliscomenobacter sp.]